MDYPLEQALKVLHNTKLPENERVSAVKSLMHHQTPEVVDILIQTLEDDDQGVRWAAADVLATFGEMAYPSLLHALVKPNVDILLRQGAAHILHQNASERIRKETGALQKALKAPGTSVYAMEEANKLLIQYINKPY